MKCRHCEKELNYTFLDLGFAPPSNSYLSKADLTKPETYYPLRVKVCDECWLVQTEDYAKADELFDSKYAYFSSTSASWLDHATLYSRKIIDRLKLSSESLVVEVASNDGYLLKNFLLAGIPCLGVEPTASTADASAKIGVEVIREFFSEDLAKALQHKSKADLIIGNNVYAHVPDLNDFTRGLKVLLKDDGVVTLEFPHLMELLKNTQFDTIYHEHFSYLSLYTVNRIFKKFGLRVFDVEQLPTHGGSLRIYGCHYQSARANHSAVSELLEQEFNYGLQSLNVYEDFQSKVDLIKNNLLEFLINQKKAGKSVAAYGAAAKGNTLLNYSGIKLDLIDYVCDAAAAKQEHFMPGSHIPIKHPSYLEENKVDFIMILPWNISSEIKQQLSFLDSTSKFVVSVPYIKIL
jgi:SAM-dependent methyltransferase